LTPTSITINLIVLIEGLSMKKIMVIGAGKIGATIVALLAATGDYSVTVLDAGSAYIDALRELPNVHARTQDICDSTALRAAMSGHFAVLSAAPYHLTTLIAEAAAACAIHYLDLTEDVASTRRVKELAVQAAARGEGTAFIPQCGLAPGFISIVAADLCRHFEQVHNLRMRVGALPQFPSNALNYNLTWSTDGVINEYCEPCDAIVEGSLRQVPPLEGLEEFSLDGVLYEAFNTSGGLGTLCETLADRVANLNYKTIRYPGHAAIMKALLNDLRLRDRRPVLKDILENALPATMQDVVIIFVTASGQCDGQLMQETYAHKVYSRRIDGVMRSAIQVTTASAICAVLDMLCDGSLLVRGFVRQEEIPMQLFLDNRFGQAYARSQDLVPA
jgi:saccharopine dehydrogenase-like NADP-dependent oxidoreductase